MNVKKFIENTMNNGGNSESLKGNIVTTGYMVAEFGKELQLPLSEFTIKNVQEYISDNAIVLSENDVFLGSWIDNGIVYLDVSRNIQDKESALKVARENEQLAIYDIENGESIYL